MPDEQNAPERALTGDARDEVIEGHRYDGIKEYDNPMPGWWVGLLWATVVFSVIYVLGLNVFGFVDSYEEDLAESQAELQEMRAAYAEANPTFDADPEALERFVGDSEMIEAGAAAYTANCAACHGQEGEGLIGPNLADKYWLHGGTNVAIYEVIAEGVPAQGMPPWQSVLSAEQIAQMVAYIRSLEGTDPAGAKEPQGELVE